MASPAETLLNCTQCGGELHPDEGQIFVTCPYCSATVYVDKTRVVFHWYVAPTLNEQQALGALYRWMSGNQTVKDLDKKATVTGQLFQYFPLWYFKVQTRGAEQVYLIPAAATSLTELRNLHLPGGDLRRYEASLDRDAVAPSVPLTAAMDWLHETPASAPANTTPPQTDDAPPAVQEMALVHVPVYLYQYQYNGRGYTALVDAASGTVLANLFPAKAEAPYLLVAGVTALIYLCLATAPVAGAIISPDGTGLAAGGLICAGAGALLTPLLFLWAYWVAAKV